MYKPFNCEACDFQFEKITTADGTVCPLCGQTVKQKRRTMNMPRPEDCRDYGACTYQDDPMCPLECGGFRNNNDCDNGTCKL